MSVGEKIRTARKKAGLTQEELARAAGVATITIRQYELGKRQPRLEQLELIANALKVPISKLVSDSASIGEYIFKAMQTQHLNLKALSESSSISEEKLNSIVLSDHEPISQDEKKVLNRVLGIDLDFFAYTGLEIYREPPVSLMRRTLLEAYDRLNEKGQQIAVDRIEELTKIPDYLKEKEETEKQNKK